MPQEATTEATAQNTSEGEGVNTEGTGAGAGTQTATTSEAATTDITQTPEFKAALTKAIEKKLPQLRKQVAKEIAGETTEGQPTAEEVQRRLTDAETRARTLEAKDALFDFVDEPKNKVNLKPESRKLFWRLAKDGLEYDDDGKPTNLKELVTSLKEEAPALFVTAKGSIDAGARGSSADPVDMNLRIRQAAGRA